MATGSPAKLSNQKQTNSSIEDTVKVRFSVYTIIIVVTILCPSMELQAAFSDVTVCLVKLCRSHNFLISLPFPFKLNTIIEHSVLFASLRSVSQRSRSHLEVNDQWELWGHLSFTVSFLVVLTMVPESYRSSFEV